jgi:hypothetical protein
MSHGNLEGKVVSQEFWPGCQNCRYFTACAVRPQHPAYPHTWHWGSDFALFSDGKLILRSWVGTCVIGQPHTGCHSYDVDPCHVSEPSSHHRQYLQLEDEREKIDAGFERLERKDVWSKRDEESFARWFRRYKEVLAQQAALLSSLPHAALLASVVNA